MDGGLSPRDLALIAQRADEHMALGTSRARADGAGAPELDDLARRLERLRQMRAPLLVVSGGGPQALARRLLNLPVRIFGYKQRRFNEDLLDLLDLTLDALRAQQREIAALRSSQAQVDDPPPGP